MKILVWCIGSSYLATIFANSINYYVALPISSEGIRRIRLNVIDQEHFYSDVPCSLLKLVSTKSVNSTKQHIFNSIQSLFDTSSLCSLVDLDDQNNVMMELLLSFVKEHDASWFSQRFCRQLLLVTASSRVDFELR